MRTASRAALRFSAAYGFPGGALLTPLTRREHRQIITAGTEALGNFNAVVGPAASS
jgi:hypothetical protein